MARLDEGALDRFVKLMAAQAALDGDAGPSSPEGSDGKAVDRVAAAEEEARSIRALLERPRTAEALAIDQLFRMRKSLEIGAEMNRVPREACSAMYRIVEAVRSVEFVAPFTETEVWTGAIALTRRSVGASWREYQGGFSRETAVAHAALRLDQLGLKSTVNAYGVGLEPDAFRDACRQIEQGIIRLGGRGVVGNVLSAMQRSGRSYEGSLLYGRRVQQLMYQPRMPSIPWHYLYNLASSTWTWVPHRPILERTGPTSSISQGTWLPA